MKLLSVSYRHFRNLEELSLAPSPRATVAVGENGQGKTNLLEGLYLLTTLKALRANRLSELIQFGRPHARVSGRFLIGGAEREIAVEVVPGGRTAFVDGKRTSKLESYFGGVSVVAFTPDDLAVVKGGPDGRRAFLDRATFNVAPAFLDESREYTRALKSRNKLLKDGAPMSHLEAWNTTLARTGARVWVRRRELLSQLSAKAAQAFERIGRAEGAASYFYAPAKLGEAFDFAGATEEALAAELLRVLDAQLPRDVERGFTSAGPHADDVEISLGGNSARAFASQGQARALVLAWKVAEIENLAARNGFLPLLLLDDVSSELDPERNAFLMNYLAASGAQTLLTTTDEKLVAAAASADTQWLSVSRGAIRPARVTA